MRLINISLLRIWLTAALGVCLFAGNAPAARHDPGRQDGQAVFPENISALMEAAAGGLGIPGLFILAPYFQTSYAATPESLAGSAAQPQSDALFAARIEVPFSTSCLLAGVVLEVQAPSPAQSQSFPEVWLVRASPLGGPDMSSPLALRRNVALSPSTASLLVDFTANKILLKGPVELYVVLRFGTSVSRPAGVRLDTLAAGGLHPGSSWLSLDGNKFLTFETAAGVFPAAPGFLARSSLGLGALILTDTLEVPAAEPWAASVGKSSGGLAVHLQLSGQRADGSPLAGAPVGVLVRDRSGGRDSILGERPLNADNTVSLPPLEPRPYLLDFALRTASGSGLYSGALGLLPADTLEPDNSPGAAVSLEFENFAGEGERAAAVALVDNSLDFDFYCLRLNSGDSLSVSLHGLIASGSHLAPELSLLDSTGAVLAHTESEGPLGLGAGYSGRYLVMVGDQAFLGGKSFQNAVDRFYNLNVRRLNRRGDVDGDGRLTYRDAFLVFFMVQGLLDPLDFSPSQRVAADFDGDGVLRGDLQDFLSLLTAITAIPSHSPDSPGAKSSPSLAGTADGWDLEFEDHSLLRLSPEGAVRVLRPGDEAARLMALLGRSAEPPDLPRAFRLEQNSPNPFNPSTRIDFSLPGAATLRLEVYDLGGRRVALLGRGEFAAGSHSVVWDGRDAAGHELPSGVYLYRLRAGAYSITRKMVLLK